MGVKSSGCGAAPVGHPRKRVWSGSAKFILNHNRYSVGLEQKLEKSS